MASKSIPDDIYDTVVIGSGPSGLACACILGKLGQKVLVLEQHDRAGGSLHTFQLGGYTFSSGKHYVGEIDQDTQSILRACGSSAKASGEDVIETYIATDTNLHMEMTARSWDSSCKRDIIRMADHMWWIAVIKLVPWWIARIMWVIVCTVFADSFIPYDVWMSRRANGGWWNMQKGDIGCDSIAMVHAAVARHYMGISTLNNFVYNSCKTIRRQGGRVVIGHRVENIFQNQGVITNGQFIRCTHVISSIGAKQTCNLIKLPNLERVCKRIGQSVRHHFTFIGINADKKSIGLPTGVIWIKDHIYMFISAEEKNHKTAVHLISEHHDMLPTFYKHFPLAKKYVEHVETATHHSVKRYLGRHSSYGLSCQPSRFNSFEHVRTLSPKTEAQNVWLTGQDILMPGIVSALHSAVMTCRQVQGITLLDTLRKRDIMDRL